MRLITLITATVSLIAFGFANPAVAEEYYVVKSRSGVIRIVDHKPEGNATIVKGPFNTREEAEKVLASSVEPKAPSPKQ
jgi:hypothetical protein